MHNIMFYFVSLEPNCSKEFLNKDVVRLISKLKNKIVDMEHKVITLKIIYKCFQIQHKI